jgi:hypothetical protein
MLARHPKPSDALGMFGSAGVDYMGGLCRHHAAPHSTPYWKTGP